MRKEPWDQAAKEFHAAIDNDAISRSSPNVTSGVRPEWMYAAACAAQRLAGEILLDVIGTNVRLTLLNSTPTPIGPIERHVLEGLIAQAERQLQLLSTRVPREEPSDIALRAAELLRNRYAEAWTIPRLARELRTNRFTLTRTFHGRFGIGVHEHLTKLRITQAQQQLIESDDKVEVIARTVGFRSSRPFFRAFFHTVRQTPAAFRCSHRHR